MFEIGQKLTKENYTQGAIWCNQHEAHIEATGGEYVITANVPVEPDVQTQLNLLETNSGLKRAVREVILAQNSGASAYVVQKAQALEALAQQLRCGNENA